mgnify:CR=1 FL=1
MTRPNFVINHALSPFRPDLEGTMTRHILTGMPDCITFRPDLEGTMTQSLEPLRKHIDDAGSDPTLRGR